MVAHYTKTLKHNRVHTLPMHDAARDALHLWLTQHRAEIDAVLAPHGVRSIDVRMPDFWVWCAGCDK